MTKKDLKQDVRVLLYGSKGWIGSLLLPLLQEEFGAANVFCGTARIERAEAVTQEIETISPHRVINCAGVTGIPNVDWCESHQAETVRSNVTGALVLADICASHDIHLTHFNTGCVFTYDSLHPMDSGIAFTEEDNPNFGASFYSMTKGMTETLLRTTFASHLLLLRPRMPISRDLHPRSLITKLIAYDRVVNIPNSMTVLHTMLPIAVRLCRRGHLGIINFTNKGTLSHNQLLALYREIVDPSFTWKNFSEEEQNKILQAPRSNNYLSTKKLERILEKEDDLTLMCVEEAVREALDCIAKRKREEELALANVCEMEGTS